jgi:2-keto-4-pentenoate hydratase/2-oxohepta-3-ene-1,7-dioic acid hydratase in catechol pathway
MRLVTFREADEVRIGALLDGGVADLNRADTSLPNSLLEVLRGGEPLRGRLTESVERCGREGVSVRPLDSVRLLAPIPRPPKIICIGLNYADHAAEAGLPIPARPSVFLKAPSTVIGPGEPIVRPATTEQLDYEIELAVVIGQRGKAIPREQALEHVAG